MAITQSELDTIYDSLNGKHTRKALHLSSLHILISSMLIDNLGPGQITVQMLATFDKMTVEWVNHEGVTIQEFAAAHAAVKIASETCAHLHAVDEQPSGQDHNVARVISKAKGEPGSD